jgi:hypothetical protein
MNAEACPGASPTVFLRPQFPIFASAQMTAKSAAIKGRGGKFGGCAVKAVGPTSGDLHCVPATRLRAP